MVRKSPLHPPTNNNNNAKVKRQTKSKSSSPASKTGTVDRNNDYYLLGSSLQSEKQSNASRKIVSNVENNNGKTSWATTHASAQKNVKSHLAFGVQSNKETIDGPDKALLSHHSDKHPNRNNQQALRTAQKMALAYTTTDKDHDNDISETQHMKHTRNSRRKSPSNADDDDDDNNNNNNDDDDDYDETQRNNNVTARNNSISHVTTPGALHVFPTGVSSHRMAQNDDLDSRSLSPHTTSLTVDSAPVTATVVTQEELIDEIREQMMMEGVVVAASTVHNTPTPSGDDDNSTNNNNKSICRLLTVAISVLVCSVIVIAVIFVVLVGSGNKNNSPPTAADTSNGDILSPTTLLSNAPTEAPTINILEGFSEEDIIFLKDLQRRGSSISLQDQSTPQYQAFIWMTQDETSSQLIRQGDYKGGIYVRFALATLYFSTNGPSWTRSDYWLSSEDTCAWYLGNFTQCIPGQDGGEDDKKVDRLELTNNNLQGTIPMELDYVKLDVLDLSGNNLTGTLPELSTRDFVYLNLSHNQLTGKVPDKDLSRAKALAHVDLSYNSFSGKFPDDFMEERAMTHLDLSFNMFNESPIPVNYFNQLGQLTYLGLAATGLTGTVPSVISLATQLKVLDLSNNSLSSVVPDVIFSMPNLELLHLQNNRFIDSFSADSPTTTSSALVSVRLDGNNIVGDIPSFLCGRRIEYDQQQSQEHVAFELYADCGELTCSCCTYCCIDNEGCSEFVGADRYLRKREHT